MAAPAPAMPPVLSLDAAGLVMIETRAEMALQVHAEEPKENLGRSRRLRAAVAEEPLVQVETQK
jgi:hypothetical protein